jgi:hypothetical protein
LRSLGFQVTERPFVFSALPGRYAAQIIGAIALVGFAAAWLLLAEWFGQLTIAAILMLTYWLGYPATTREPWFQETGINLEATRGDPRVWLVAHIDSKSQPIPTAVRSVGVILVALAGGLQFIVPWPLDMYLYQVGIVGAIILLIASVGSKSPGAADNASGVAAVLEAASLVRADKPIGVLITDAEELALAGATAWCAGRAAGIALNCDTIDDAGRLVIFRYPPERALAGLAARAAADVDPKAKAMAPPLGVLTDSNAFARARWQTLTLARGTIRTLNRIHTRRDSLDNLRGTGIPDAAKALARIVEELT